MLGKSWLICALLVTFRKETMTQAIRSTSAVQIAHATIAYIYTVQIAHATIAYIYTAAKDSARKENDNVMSISRLMRSGR